MNKFLKLNILVSSYTMAEMERYQNEMEEWTTLKNNIGRSPGSPPSLGKAVYRDKWINFSVYSVDQWMPEWDKENECVIILAILTHLPTRQTIQINARYKESEWINILNQLDNQVILITPVTNQTQNQLSIEFGNNGQG